MREALGSVKIDRPALKARAAAYTADAAAVAFETILYERGLIGAQFARMPAAPLHARKSAS